MIGKKISHYKILQKLGEGGMGVVYKAEDTKLKRPVALKFLSPQLTKDPEAVKRFINEAQTASALDHANICTIYQIDETKDGQLFIAMAYYEGETLKHKLSGGPLPLDDAIDIAIQTGQGLIRAHEAGIMHRDIKPDNIVVTDRNEVKLIDFGIAKLATQSGMTQTGSTLGTMAYMSPEQLQGKEIDHRTDIWSLGVTLYQMLIGESPFGGEYEAEMLYSIMHEPPKDIQASNLDLSSNLVAILDRALEKEPEDRYQSVRELILELQALSEPSPEAGKPELIKSKSKKATYLPNYQNDIFLSYAQIDDKPLSKGQKGWISNFHQVLEVRLEQLLGADIMVSRGDKTVAKVSSDGDGMTLPSAAIMVSVMSPQYVKSEKCLQEVTQFCELAEENEGLWLNNQARIVKAIKTPVARESQPEELQSIPDYEFYQFDPSSGRPQEFRPELGGSANRNFWLKLEDIAYDIFRLMEALKTRKAASSRKRAAAGMPSIYLAETTHDLSSHRDMIKRQLQQRGYSIRPDRPLPLNANDLQKQVEAELTHCSLSIHLIGENYGIVPEGEKRSIPEIQHQMAIRRSHGDEFSRLIWLPPGLQAQDERQQKFIKSFKKDTTAQIGADLLQTSLGEFKSFLIDKLSDESKNGKEEAFADSIIRIYLQCDQKDLDATAPLEEYLFEEGFEIRLPAFEGDELEVFDAHKENLLLCDATIIYYGSATDSWLSTKLADLQKVAGYGRTKPMKVKAVYLAGPETKHKQRFRTREALTIRNFGNFSPEQLKPFVSAMQNGKGQ